LKVPIADQSCKVSEDLPAQEFVNASSRDTLEPCRKPTDSGKSVASRLRD